jgi:hypothetical protein
VFALLDHVFNSVALSLAIDELLFVCGQLLWTILGAIKARVTHAHIVTLRESPIRPSAVNLIGTDHLLVVAISAAIGSSLGFQFCSFVVGVETQPIKGGESVNGDRDRDLGARLSVAPRIAANNQPDLGLVEAEDANTEPPTVGEVTNGLLSAQLDDNHGLLMGTSTAASRSVLQAVAASMLAGLHLR